MFERATAIFTAIAAVAAGFSAYYANEVVEQTRKISRPLLVIEKCLLNKTNSIIEIHYKNLGTEPTDFICIESYLIKPNFDKKLLRLGSPKFISTYAPGIPAYLKITLNEKVDINQWEEGGIAIVLKYRGALSHEIYSDLVVRQWAIFTTNPQSVYKFRPDLKTPPSLKPNIVSNRSRFHTQEVGIGAYLKVHSLLKKENVDLPPISPDIIKLNK